VPADGPGEAVPGVPDGAATPTIARNAFYLLLGQVSTTALAIFLNAALGRFLGAQDFGLYYLITTMSTFAYVFVEWGQPIIVIREVAQDPPRSGDLLGAALALRVALVALVTVPAWLVAHLVGYDERTRWLSTLFIVANLPLSLAQGYGMVFRAHDRMGRDATVSVSHKALALGITIFALAAGAGILGVISAHAVAGATALTVAGFLYRRLRAAPVRFSPGTARKLVAAGVPILAMTAAVSGQPYVDAIILSKLAPAAVVGWFGAARNILGTLLAPANILAAAAYPRLARTARDPAVFGQEVRAAFRTLLWLAALAGTGTYLFAGTAVRLIYGSRGFGPATQVLEVFAPGLFLLFVDLLLATTAYASGRGTFFAVAKIVSLGVGAGLDIVLVPLFQARYNNGGIGVVVAFALSELAVLAGCLMALRRGTLGATTALNVARALGAAAATIGLLHLLPPVPPWVGIPLCVIAFTAASFALGLVGPRDLATLLALMKR
jgi:O-antigen/teichoic acid export membrane protein